MRECPWAVHARQLCSSEEDVLPLVRELSLLQGTYSIFQRYGRIFSSSDRTGWVHGGAGADSRE